jgi:hypothetical protein
MDDPQLVAAVVGGAIGGMLGVAGALGSVAVASNIETGRRQRHAMQQAQRLLWTMQQMYFYPEHFSDDAEAKNHAFDDALNQFETLIPQMPWRVRELESKAADVLDVRDRVRSPSLAVLFTTVSARAALAEALGSSKLHWWFVLRWRRAEEPPLMRSHVDAMLNVRLKSIEDLLEMLEKEKLRRERLAAGQAVENADRNPASREEA